MGMPVPAGETLSGEMSRLDKQNEIEKKTVRRLRRIFYASVLLCVLLALDMALMDVYFPNRSPFLKALRIPLLMWAIVISVYVFRTMSLLERAARARMEDLGRRDTLTGAYSLAYSIYALQEMRGLTHEGVRELAVGYIHIVGVEQVNMRYGHAAGTIVIRNLAQLLSDAIPYGALLCRMGGVEFGAFMPETSVKEAWATLTKIQEAVRATEIDLAGRGKISGLDARIGLIIDKGGKPIEDLMRAACESAVNGTPPQEGS